MHKDDSRPVLWPYEELRTSVTVRGVLDGGEKRNYTSAVAIFPKDTSNMQLIS